MVQTKIKYLGLVIEDGKHHLQPHILNNIQQFPSNISEKTQLQRFLGCLTYAEAYIKKGAVLNSKTTEGEQLCRYTSGSFSRAELNYHSNEKEYLSLKKAIKKFSIYVIIQKFIVRCDNKNFTFLEK